MATAAAIFGSLLVYGALGLWVAGVRKVLVPDVRAMRYGLIAGGLLTLFALVSGASGPLGVLCGVGLVSAALFLALDRIAPLPAVVPTIRVGGPAHDFSLVTSEGETFALESLRGRPVLLKFFRGYW